MIEPTFLLIVIAVLLLLIFFRLGDISKRLREIPHREGTGSGLGASRPGGTLGSAQKQPVDQFCVDTSCSKIAAFGWTLTWHKKGYWGA